ncbi:heavy metal translocatin [Exidia glandulosa HHB12029]|uniref:Heavy metal translocatin n=1 Tax=Exidia glandulosa HHB12029 TaxID=1314781 RepID=A0A165IAB7_EXIGL|nr:heavy metal translocatin [Exidia glandulosa HHB12029]
MLPPGDTGVDAEDPHSQPCCASDHCEDGPARSLGIAGDRFVVGDCLPDGAGGCQRSLAHGASCCKTGDGLANDACCGGTDADSCSEGCCAKDDAAAPIHAAHDDCCPGHGEANVIGQGTCCPNVTDACCSDDASVDSCDASCCGGRKDIAAQLWPSADAAAPSKTGGCCSDCATPVPQASSGAANVEPAVSKGCCDDCASDFESVVADAPAAAEPQGICCAAPSAPAADDGPANKGCCDDCGSDSASLGALAHSAPSASANAKSGSSSKCCDDCGPAPEAVIAHSHTHSHAHAHEHSHEHEHPHSHEHEHPHSHEHGHSHEHSHAHASSHGHSKDNCCEGHGPSAAQTVRRRAAPHAHGSGDAHSPVAGHDHVHKHASGSNRKARHKHKHHKHHKHSHSSGDSSSCAAETTMGRFYEVACCCLIDWARARKRNKAKDDCCGHDHSHDDKSVYSEKASGSHDKAADVERGGGKRLTMLMSVEGMDCPSCASKVTRALLSIPSVRDVKVNVFAAQATLGYSEGLAFPFDIAKRTAELTGFACGVMEESIPQGEVSVLRIRVPPTLDISWEKASLPPGVSIKSQHPSVEGTMLEVEFNTLSILPRDVVAAFSRWDGVFVPTPRVRVSEQADKELRSLFRRSFISVLLCVPVLIFSWAPLPSHPVAYGGACLALATIIQVYVGSPIYSASLRSLFLQRILDMDLLVVLSTSIAYVFSIVAYSLLVSGHFFSDPFFETSSLLITLITLGRLLSAYARRFATSTLDELYMLQVDVVELLDSKGVQHTISTELIHKGDILVISPDSLVPTDGIVQAGTSLVDESTITGESIPVEKLVGSRLTAGTLNTHGTMHMRVERMPSDNTVAEIGHLMLEVQNQRLPIQDLADKVASYLAPVILAISIITFSIWIAIELKVRHEDSGSAGVAALRYSIAVMVVSCPCALVLCVPMVVVITTAVASKLGILFKSAEAVQYAKDTQVAVFDKTGTLTTGVLSVADSHIQNEDAIPIILGLVSGSRHPVSQAIFNHLSMRYPGVQPTKLSDIISLPGQGLECLFNAISIRGGNATWLNMTAHPDIESLQAKALTIFAVTIESNLVAAFGLSDTLRLDAHSTVEMLGRRGIDVYIVSGDSQRVVDALAAQIHIPAERAFGGCLPQDKLARVRALQRTENGEMRRVMFVGDGTNDALALAQSDLGVSFSSGTSVAASAASVLLLNPSLCAELDAILTLSLGASRRIYINFAWSFVYNLLAVLAAAGAFVKIRIAPEYAGLGEIVSVLPVVIIAWSIRIFKK